MKYKYIFLSILFLLFSCNQISKIKKIGMEIPDGLEVTKLSDILSNPLKYNGNKVLLEGTVVSVCASGCDFVYQEGNKTVEIYPNNFKVVGLKNGQQVRVYAEIQSGKERIVVSALGMEVIQK